MPDYLLTLNFTPLGFVSSILPYFIIIICITLLVNINKENIKSFMYKYYFYKLNTQFLVLLSFVLVFIWYLNFNILEIALIIFLLTLVYLSYSKYSYYSLLITTIISVFLLTETYTFLNIAKLLITLYMLYTIIKTKTSEINKPLSANTFRQNVLIYSYHVRYEVNILNFTKYLLVVLFYISFSIKDPILNFYFGCIFAVLGFINILNIFVLLVYCNPVFNSFYKAGVFLVNAAPNLTLTSFGILAISCSGVVPSPPVFPFPHIQKAVYGYKMTQMGIMLYHLMDLHGYQHPPCLPNGFYDNRTALQTLTKNGIEVKLIPESKWLPTYKVAIYKIEGESLVKIEEGKKI